MEPNLGTKGATRQSWSRDSIRQVFHEIQREYPKAAHDRLVQLMCDRANDERDVLIAAMDYIVTNFTNTQEGYERHAPAIPSPPRPTAEEIAARQQADLEQRASIKAQIMLLNLPMANGKLARNCTGKELVEIGGAWVNIGKKIGANKLLGQVLNESQLQAFFKKEST